MIEPESWFRLAAGVLVAAYLLFPPAPDAPRLLGFLLRALIPLPVLLLLSAPAGLWMSDFLRASAVLACAAGLSSFLLSRIPRGWRPAWVVIAAVVLFAPILAVPVPALGIEPGWSPLVLVDECFRPAPVEPAKDWVATPHNVYGPTGLFERLADPFPTLDWPLMDRKIALIFALAYAVLVLSWLRHSVPAWRAAVAFWLLFFAAAFTLGPGRGTAVAQTLTLRPYPEDADAAVDLLAVSVRRPGEVLRFSLPPGNWRRLLKEAAPPRQQVSLTTTPETRGLWPFRRWVLIVTKVEAQLWPGERLVLARQERRSVEDDSWRPSDLPRVRHLGSYRGLGIPMSER